MSLKLSVIVPTYNVEKYIRRCLESLYFQDIDHSLYEIIIVNDGSTDQSLNIVEELTAKWKNIKIISQDNAGLSEARNSGLQSAQGEYIWFVDSDDWIEPNSLQYLTSNLKDLDILMIEHNIAKETTKTINNIRFEKPNQTYTGIQILDQRNPQNCVPFYIYRKDLLIKNEIRFRKGVYYEDSLFTPIILCYAQKIRFLSKAIYNYFQRTGSITNSRPTIKHCLDCILISKELINFSSKRDEFQNYEYKLLNNRIASIMGRFVLNWLKLDIKNKIIVLQAWSSNKDILKYVRKSNRYKTYILLHLMTLIGYFCPCR